MRIRKRLSFRSGPEEQESKPEEAPRAAPPSPAVSEPKRTASTDGLSEALDTVARVMVGEVESLRRALEETETRLAARIDAEKAAAAAAVDALRQTQHSTLTEAVSNLRELLQRFRDKADDRSKEVREGLEEILSAKEHKLEKGLTALADKLAEVRGDLARQAETSGSVSALLDNVANVFTDQKARPTVSADADGDSPRRAS